MGLGIGVLGFGVCVVGLGCRVLLRIRIAHVTTFAVEV